MISVFFLNTPLVSSSAVIPNADKAGSAMVAPKPRNQANANANVSPTPNSYSGAPATPSISMKAVGTSVPALLPSIDRP